jgi:hypothetical protein
MPDSFIDENPKEVPEFGGQLSDVGGCRQLGEHRDKPACCRG